MRAQLYAEATWCSTRTCWSIRLFMVVWVLLSGLPIARGDDESARNRFLEEYRPHFERLKEHYTNAFVAYTFTYADNSEKKQAIHQASGKFNSRNHLLRGGTKWVEKETGKVLFQSSEADVECSNDLYSFMLSAKEGRDYVLDKLTTHDAAHAATVLFLSAPYADHSTGKTYLDIAQDPKIRVTAFADCTWQGKSAKVLECRFPPPPGMSNEGIRRYYFAPGDGWVCVGASISSDNITSGVKGEKPEKGAYEDIYFYESEEGERLPRFRRMEQWTKYTNASHKSKCRKVTDITEYRRSPTPFPDQDFRLSAFGLPEPKSVKQPLSHMWLWLIAAAVGAASLAFLFAWLKRRAKASPTKT